MKKYLLFIFLCSYLIVSCNKGNKPAAEPAKQAAQQQTSQPAVSGRGSLINPDGSVTLKLNVSKGEKYDMEMISDQKIVQEMQGQKQEVFQKMGFIYNYAIEDADAQGNMTTKITYSSIYQEVDAGQGKIVFDSKNPPKVESPQTKILLCLIGKGFTVKQNPMGKVLDLKGTEEILKSIVKKMELKEPEQEKQLTASLNEQFGTGRMSEMVEKLTNFYDGVPKKTGDKWTKEYTSSGEFNMMFSSEYTVKEIKGNSIVIDISSKLQTDPKAKPTEYGSVLVRYSLKGTQKGTIEIDARSGMILNTNVYQKLSGKISSLKSETVKESITVPMSIETTNTIKTTKK